MLAWTELQFPNSHLQSKHENVVFENGKTKNERQQREIERKKNTIWKSQFKCSTFFYCFDCVVLGVLFYSFLFLFANDSYCFCCCVLSFVFSCLFFTRSISLSLSLFLFYFISQTTLDFIVPRTVEYISIWRSLMLICIRKQ